MVVVMQKRSVLLDALRGLAIIMMLSFHIMFDLREFYGLGVDYRAGIWKWINFFGAFLFMLICGWAVGACLNKRPFWHGMRILLAAMLITFVTYFFDSSSYVRFGVLHFLACALLIAPLMLTLPDKLLIVLSMVIILLNEFFSGIIVNTSLLIPIGLTPSDFVSIDYYPLVPWLSVFLLGIFFGRKLGVEKCEIDFVGLDVLAVLGKHSLMIYLVHQPVFLLILKLILG